MVIELYLYLCGEIILRPYHAQDKEIVGKTAPFGRRFIYRDGYVIFTRRERGKLIELFIEYHTVISDLNEEIRTMEADSAEIQAKLKLYTDGDLSVIEDVAREQGLIKENEDIFIIK